MSIASQISIRIAYHLLKWAGDDTSDVSAKRFRKILDHTRRQRRRELLENIVKTTKKTVIDGPFEGLTFSDETCRHDIFIGAKLLGYYEREIQDLLASWQDKSIDAIINIGSSSGYFAVGSTKLLNPKHIWAVDIQETELKICQENFALNDLDKGVEYCLSMNGDELAELTKSHTNALVISDCEGFEKELFTADTISAFGNAHLIIECHDFAAPGITDQLTQLFSESHDLILINEGARDPNTSLVLQSLPSNDRWLVLSEDRPETMHWLIATPKK